MKKNDKISRRQFIKKLSQFGIGMVAVPCLPSLLTSSIKPLYSTVGIAIGKVKEEILTDKAIELLGGIKNFIKQGDKVVVKPNLLVAKNYKLAATTNPFVIKKIIELCFSAGAKNVTVTDNPSDSSSASLVFKVSGIEKVCKETGAEIIIPDENRFIQKNLNGKEIKEYPVYKPMIECDKLINVAIAKDHMSTNYTGAMKNLMGAIGGNRFMLHSELHQSIVDLAKYFKPTLNIVDGYRVMFRNGPNGGSPKDVLEKFTIIASTDIVSADVFGAQLLNLTIEKVEHIKLANEQKVGNADTSKIKEIVARL